VRLVFRRISKAVIRNLPAEGEKSKNLFFSSLHLPRFCNLHDIPSGLTPNFFHFVTFFCGDHADALRSSIRNHAACHSSYQPQSMESTVMNNLEQAGRLDSASIRVSPTVQQHSNQQEASAASVIFRAGLACGVLDITAAFVTWSLRGVSPYRLLQAIASGLLGVQAFRGGGPTALLGAALHFFIAFSVATVFYAASRKLKLMTQHAIRSGFAFGIAVYLVMYLIVMPLSRIQPTPFSLSRTVIAIVTHMFCVGLPISLTVRRLS
jgi:hypothetical protein